MEGIGFIMTLTAFKYETSPYKPGYYVITVDHEKFHITGTKGSCHIIEARVMNLSYAQYLRMCRDLFGAEIIGKNSMYPVAYFKNIKMVFKLLQFDS